MTPITTTRQRRRAIAVPLAVVTAALLAAGCGSVGYSEGTGDQDQGQGAVRREVRQLPRTRRRRYQGSDRPEPRRCVPRVATDGLGESTIVQVVRGQIAYPITTTSTGAPGMPADLVTGQDAEDVASYVGKVAGK